MKIGTKSVLFGAHCWFIHPFFVALAWWKLYGFPRDLRLWVAFFVHDVGYWSLPNMDGPEGEEHVWLGANIMHRLFDRTYIWSRWFDLRTDQEIVDENLNFNECVVISERPTSPAIRIGRRDTTWQDFCLYHSRFYAKKNGMPFSKLCVADKLSIAIEPWWFYLPRVWLSGELKEYLDLAKTRTDAGEPRSSKYQHMDLNTISPKYWKLSMSDYLVEWVNEHKDMKEDTWTPKS